MNATELFLNLLATDANGIKSDSMLQLKPAEKAEGAIFRATLSKTLQLHSSRTTANSGIEQAEYKPPIGNANFTQRQQPADVQDRQAQDTAPSTATHSAYRSASRLTAAATTQQTSQPEQTQNAPSSQVQEAETTPTAQVSAQQAPAADAQQSSAPEASSASAELQSIVDDLKKQAADGKDPANAQLAQLLLNLITLLLSNNDDSAIKDLAKQLGLQSTDGKDGLNLTLFVDKDSELYKQLSTILSQVSKMPPEVQKQVQLLVKISEDKAIEIPIEDLIAKAQNATATTGDQQQNALAQTLGAQDGAGNTAEIDLKITPEALADAKIVDLPAEMKDATAAAQADAQQPAQAKQAEIALLVPAELLQQAKQSAADGAAQGVANTQLLAPDAQAAEQKLQLVLIPIVPANEVSESKVLTTDAQFQQSDKFLAHLDMQALVKEMADARKPRAELAARLERLFSAAKSTEPLTTLASDGKSGGFDPLKGLLDRYIGGGKDQNGQAQQQAQQWQAEALKQQLQSDSIKQQFQTESVKQQLQADTAPARLSFTDRVSADFSADRISFMGRPTESAPNLFQQVSQAAETSQARPSPELYQNVMDQVTGRIQMASMSAAGGEMRIFLRPENLGDVHLKVRVDQDVVTAKFVAHTQEVKAIIEANLNQLKDALAEAGIKAGKIVVTLQDGQNQQPAQDGGNQNTAQEARYNGATADSASPADETAAYNEFLPMDDNVIYSRGPLAAAASSRVVNYLA